MSGQPQPIQQHDVSTAGNATANFYSPSPKEKMATSTTLHLRGELLLYL
jgi:hypothetical protein